MEKLIQILQLLGSYRIPAVIFSVEVFVAVCLLLAGLSLGGRYHYRNFRANRGGKRARQEKKILFERDREPELLIHRKDRYPEFQTESFARVFGVTKEQMQADLTCFLDQMDENFGKKFWKSYQRWDGKSEFETEIQLKDSECWYRIRVLRSWDEQYDWFRFADITQYRTQITQTEEKLEKAEEVSQSKTTFLSNMSHEIRTPMNGIIGMLTLAHGKLNGHQAEPYIERAEQLSQYLLSVINDILDMSRIEAGKIELEKKAFSLQAMAEQLRAMFQKNIEAKGVAFSVELQDFDLDWVIGDELRLSQVLVNFLSNASKFTSSGEIRVLFRQLLKENGRVSLMMRVHDTGTGMDTSFVSRIFRPFEQENSHIARQYGGSGLGMAITDQIVRLMGGEIVIDSMKGRGSDFTVYLTLPIAENQNVDKQALEEERAVESFDYQGMHILMAEDNEVNAEIAVSILEMNGAKVDTVVDGQQAIEQFEVCPPGTYDFILMDIQMPVMDGRTASRAIRAMNRPDAKTIPIFALSADAFVEDQRLSAESGMNGHFSKPIDFEKMKKEIGKILIKGKRVGA